LSTELRSPHARDPVQVLVLQRPIDWASEEPERPLAAILFDVSNGRAGFNPLLDVLCGATLVDQNHPSLVYNAVRDWRASRDDDFLIDAEGARLNWYYILGLRLGLGRHIVLLRIGEGATLAGALGYYCWGENTTVWASCRRVQSVASDVS
jgi:hypothetical protein